MTSAANHQDLIRRARAADPQAITTIYEHYSTSIFRYIYYRVGDVEQARDLQADVFLRMIEGLERYEDRGWSIGAWLYRIAHDRTIDQLRRSQRRNLQSLNESHEAVDGPEWASELRSEHSALRQAMNRLGEDQRRVLLLRFVYELSLQDTANQLGRTVGAVKSMQHRALDNLRRMMRDGIEVEMA